MRTLILAAIAALLLTVPAHAQIAVSGGSTKDFIKVGGAWEEVATPMAGVSYDIGFAADGAESYNGVTLSMRGSDGEDFIQEYGVDYWSVGVVEWFIGAVGETWSPGLTGSREFLGGGRVGIRGSAVGGAPIELSASYVVGGDGKRHVGIFFGLRVSTG